MIPFIDAAALFDFIDVELTRTWKPDYSGGKFSQYSMDMRKLAKIQDLRGEGESGPDLNLPTLGRPAESIRRLPQVLEACDVHWIYHEGHLNSERVHNTLRRNSCKVKSSCFLARTQRVRTEKAQFPAHRLCRTTSRAAESMRTWSGTRPRTPVACSAMCWHCGSGHGCERPVCSRSHWFTPICQRCWLKALAIPACLPHRCASGTRAGRTRTGGTAAPCRCKAGRRPCHGPFP